MGVPLGVPLGIRTAAPAEIRVGPARNRLPQRRQNAMAANLTPMPVRSWPPTRRAARRGASIWCRWRRIPARARRARIASARSNPAAMPRRTAAVGGTARRKGWFPYRPSTKPSARQTFAPRRTVRSPSILRRVQLEALLRGGAGLAFLAGRGLVDQWLALPIIEASFAAGRFSRGRTGSITGMMPFNRGCSFHGGRSPSWAAVG